MTHTLFETLMLTLILVCIFMGVVFITHQRQGQTFVASFDKAMVYGSGLFAIGCCLSVASYMA